MDFAKRLQNEDVIRVITSTAVAENKTMVERIKLQRKESLKSIIPPDQKPKAIWKKTDSKLPDDLLWKKPGSGSTLTPELLEILKDSSLRNSASSTSPLGSPTGSNGNGNAPSMEVNPLSMSDSNISNFVTLRNKPPSSSSSSNSASSSVQWRKTSNNIPDELKSALKEAGNPSEADQVKWKKSTNDLPAELLEALKEAKPASAHSSLRIPNKVLLESLQSSIAGLSQKTPSSQNLMSGINNNNNNASNNPPAPSPRGVPPSVPARKKTATQTSTSNLPTPSSQPSSQQSTQPTTRTLPSIPSQSSGINPNPRPLPPTQKVEYRKALWGKGVLEDGELAFEAGDVITVIKTDPSGWWKGKLGSSVGIFPSNYTEPYTPK